MQSSNSCFMGGPAPPPYTLSNVKVHAVSVVTRTCEEATAQPGKKANDHNIQDTRVPSPETGRKDYYAC